MDNIKFNQTGGFPLDTDIMGAMQTAYSLFNSLGNLAGNKAIISGCTVAGSSVSDGVVFIDGEVLPFKGGPESTNVFIKEEIESRIFEDGATKPVIVKRYATFGSSTPEKTFAWAEFKRFDNLLKNAEKNADFEKRIKALETKKSPIPIGLIAIWNKPSTEPIPKGWQECMDLRGRFPLGWNPDDLDFNELGREDGEKEHTLTIQEMPEHNHEYEDIYYSEAHGHVGVPNAFGSARSDNDNSGHQMRRTSYNKGGNQPHNNMPPYKIIRFIEFVGFD